MKFGITDNQIECFELGNLVCARSDNFEKVVADQVKLREEGKQGKESTEEFEPSLHARSRERRNREPLKKTGSRTKSRTNLMSEGTRP